MLELMVATGLLEVQTGKLDPTSTVISEFARPGGALLRRHRIPAATSVQYASLRG